MGLRLPNSKFGFLVMKGAEVVVNEFLDVKRHDWRVGFRGLWELGLVWGV